jgi:CRISPR-associated endoribonuclease Cas6
LRIQVILTKEKGNLLPINYKYELSSWIYKVLHRGNPDFSDWLHSQGYTFEKRRFKLFTFSDLFGFEYVIKKDRLMIQSNEVQLILGFRIDEAVQHFIEGLFKNQKMGLGDKHSQVDFIVSRIERLPDPVFNKTVSFETLCPMIISKPRDQNGTYGAEYLSPEHAEFAERLFNNLEKKAIAEIHTNTSGVFSFESTPKQFELLSKPKRKKITVKAHTPRQTELIGYEFRYRITAPTQLIEIGYDAGFGEKNSLGFGCVLLQNDMRRK